MDIKVLYAVRKARLTYQRYKLKAEVIRARLEYPSGGGGEKSTPTNANTIEWTQMDYVEATVQMDAAQKEWKRAETEALTMIARVKDPNQGTILTMRFIDFLSFPKIATVVGYSERQTIRLFVKGLQFLRKAKG